MHKSTKFVLAIIPLLAIVLIAGVLLAKYQRDKDYSLLERAVATRISVLGTQRPERTDVSCNKGNCDALRYKVSEAECLKAIKQLERNAEKCSGALKINFESKDIRINLGSIYDERDVYPGLYIEVSLQ